MEHPLVEIDPKANIEQIQSKVSELTKKLSQAHRMGNAHLVRQVQMALDSYNSRLRTMYAELAENERKNSGKDYNDMIDIS